MEDQINTQLPKRDPLNPKYLIFGVILFVLTLGLGFFLGRYTSYPGPVEHKDYFPIGPTVPIVSNTGTSSPATTSEVPSPAEVTQNFYNIYNACVVNEDRNPSGQNRIKVCGEKYKQYLTSSLYDKLITYYEGPYDPILCSQAYYAEIFVKGGGIEEENKANALVIASFQPGVQSRNTSVNLIKLNNQWLLNEIQCSKF